MNTTNMTELKEMANRLGVGKWLLKRAMPADGDEYTIVKDKDGVKMFDVIAVREDIPLVSIFNCGSRVGNESKTWLDRLEITVDRVKEQVTAVSVKKGFEHSPVMSPSSIINYLGVKASQWA